MTISFFTIWEQNAAATANMVNGGGFNPNNANFPTDGSLTSANTTAPRLTSATYSFVAGDVGARVYLANTSQPGFYPIASVSSGAATLNAAIGAGEFLNTSVNRWQPTTVAGVDATASPTGKTYGVDYSRGTTAIVNAVTDFAAVGASTTLTSATAAFTPAMVGNFFHQTTTGTGAFGVVGWYEVVSYANATTVTLDRTPNSGTASVACTGYIGGALDLAGALQSSFYSQIVGGNFVFMKNNGAFALGAASTGSGSNSSTTSPSYIIGYNSVRGDNPMVASGNAPVIAAGANAMVFATAQFLSNISVSGTAAAVLTMGTSGNATNVKATNTSTTAARVAFATGTNSTCDNIEAVSQNGIAASIAAGSSINGFYFHDSNIGANIGATGNQALSDGIVASCTTTGINGSNGNSMLSGTNLTVYGSEAKSGNGIVLLNANIRWFLKNCLIYGTTLGLSQGTTQQAANVGSFNNFFNNTTDVTNWTKDITDMAINPGFASVGQLTGTTATTSGSVLTDSGASFNGNITDGVDYLRVISGTGVTVGITLITSHTNTTLTVNNPLGTSSAGNVVYSVPNKHNYSVGTALKGTAFPGPFPGGLTTGYLDVGAAQRQEPTGGGASTQILQSGIIQGMGTI